MKVIQGSSFVDPPGHEREIKRMNRYRLVYSAMGASKQKEFNKEFNSVSESAAVDIAERLITTVRGIEAPRLQRWIWVDGYVKIGFWCTVAHWEKDDESAGEGKERG